MSRQLSSIPFRWRILCCLTALVSVLVVALPAHATPYGAEPGGIGAYPDSTDHWYCFYNIGAGYDQTRINEAMEYLDQRTVMYDVYAGSCAASTDVVFAYQSPLYVGGFQFVGYWNCAAYTGLYMNLCDNGLVRADTSLIWSHFNGNYDKFNFNLHKVIRHELGHSAGLTHQEAYVNIMSSVQFVEDISNWNHLVYQQHECWHINNFFGSSC